jgi:hypothetical protein
VPVDEFIIFKPYLKKVAMILSDDERQRTRYGRWQFWCLVTADVNKNP